jgi:holo-[acyl-carrier protein] synthase
MITGVGIDMIEIERVAEKIGKNSGFRELVFSEAEIAYCERMTHKFEHYAARFAAKEAFLKAIGTGWTSEHPLTGIEVSHDATGKPLLQLHPKVIAAIPVPCQRIHLSLSHLKSIATAIVILEAD